MIKYNHAIQEKEVNRLLEGIKKVKAKVYIVPKLKMTIRLKKGITILKFINNYVADRFQTGYVYHKIKKYHK